MPTDPHEGLPRFARDVLELFARQLADVQFPGLDLSVLRREAEQVLAAQEEVDRIEAALEQARATVEERAQALTHLAHRALAYARIYAEDKPELKAEVAAISAPRTVGSTDAPASKKRGRPRKTSGDAGLFSEVERSAPELEAQAV